MPEKLEFHRDVYNQHALAAKQTYPGVWLAQTPQWDRLMDSLICFLTRQLQLFNFIEFSSEVVQLMPG